MNHDLEMAKGNTYTIYKILGTAVLFIMVIGMSCTKPPDDTPLPPFPTPPVVNKPSGVIEKFELVDSLVGYNWSYGTLAKWLVNGTNMYSIVRFNDSVVGIYGAMATGPQIADTVFTLSVNNGVEAKVRLKVADSITTKMWNGGVRFLKKTKSELKEVMDTVWKDSAIAAQVSDQRIFFQLNKGSTIIQAHPNTWPSPPYGGMFTVKLGNPAILVWRGVTYTIVSLDSKQMIVTYSTKDVNGAPVEWRDTYEFGG